MLHRGQMSICEPGPDVLPESNVTAGRLCLTNDLGLGLAGTSAKFIAVGAPISSRTYELVKQAANAFLATKTTVNNETPDLCDKAGTDVQDVSRAIAMDHHIGSKLLHAGSRHRGSCSPKEGLTLLKSADDYESSTRVGKAAVKVNDSRKRAMGRTVVDALGGPYGACGKKVALLRLAFKPNTDSTSDLPTVAIALALNDAGVEVINYDPERIEHARLQLPEVNMCENSYAAIAATDVVVIDTEWDASRRLDLVRVKDLAKAPLRVDPRNVESSQDGRAVGFTSVSFFGGWLSFSWANSQ